MWFFPDVGGDQLVLELPDLLHGDQLLFKVVSLKGPPISTIKMLWKGGPTQALSCFTNIQRRVLLINLWCITQ